MSQTSGVRAPAAPAQRRTRARASSPKPHQTSPKPTTNARTRSRARAPPPRRPRATQTRARTLPRSPHPAQRLAPPERARARARARGAVLRTSGGVLWSRLGRSIIRKSISASLVAVCHLRLPWRLFLREGGPCLAVPASVPGRSGTAAAAAAATTSDSRRGGRGRLAVGVALFRAAVLPFCTVRQAERYARREEGLRAAPAPWSPARSPFTSLGAARRRRRRPS